MKNFSRMLISTVLLTAFTQTFAQAKNDGCPPISMIVENAVFTHVEESDWAEIWGMASNQFNYNNEAWNILLVITLPQVKNKSNALQQGNEFFKNRVVLNEPSFQEEANHKICMYAQK